jgi:hypothetical protein
MINRRSDLNKLRTVTQGPQYAERAARARLDADRQMYLLAKIVEFAAIAGTSYRYIYTWTRAEIKLSSVGSGNDFQSRASETYYTGTALNICEAANTASFIGPGINPANIPSGFSFKPIEGYVLLFPQRRMTVGAAGSELVWCFYAANAIDGVCA